MNRKKIRNEELKKVKGGAKGQPDQFEVTADACEAFSLNANSEDTSRTHKNCIYLHTGTCPYYISAVPYPEQRELN